MFIIWASKLITIFIYTKKHPEYSGLTSCCPYGLARLKDEVGQASLRKLYKYHIN
ncbi:MAG: hypothetical protein H8D45_32550 [Bacteroidetes bacterium]|nr:hypothetical protein [Bacteroidota bacterium]